MSGSETARQPVNIGFRIIENIFHDFARDVVTKGAGRNLSLILQRDIERNIEVYELSMQAVIDGVSGPAILRLPPEIRQRVLFDRSTNAQDMGSLLVTNSGGDVVVDSRSVPPRRVNLSDRDYFTIQQQSANSGLFISKPFLPHLTKTEMSVGLSQRWKDSQGKYTGIVVGTLRLNYFHRLFDGMSSSPPQSCYGTPFTSSVPSRRCMVAASQSIRLCICIPTHRRWDGNTSI
ncbi:hypothetical protein CBM2598_U10087 [Cupriavidus taiwanensis]|uniref:Cache domain-containing protein n=1 Tax=Cupriavidus taiwanensis TaxID=164546 RepID=A0A7Z7JHY9_9BURK|nr:hypothetical protein CBM2597_U10263 [Cupriavidus taiwanensis]SOZ96266.1 hypothetical protein CBM2598_U10087 [Cupriavidus taiwanensis]SPC25768.1 hypothetical protein CBM2594_U10269 [Cupriavidus taiwanensis]